MHHRGNSHHGAHNCSLPSTCLLPSTTMASAKNTIDNNQPTPNDNPFSLESGLYFVIFPKAAKYRDTTNTSEVRICFGEISHPELYHYYHTFGYILGKMNIEGSMKMSVLKWGPAIENTPPHNNTGNNTGIHQKYSYEAFFIKIPSRTENVDWKTAVNLLKDACEISSEQTHVHTKFF